MILKEATYTFWCLLLFCCPLKVLGQEQLNILLIIADDLNTNIGPYTNIDNHTPNLNRLAKAGIRFDKAYAQYPECGPSRASILSGLYPETNGVVENQLKKGSYKSKTPALANHPSIAEFFRQQGYYTARVSKVFHMGVPGGIEQGAAGDDDPAAWDYCSNILGPETQSRGDLELLSPGNLHYGSNAAKMVLKNGAESTQTDYIATSQAIAILENRAGALVENAMNRTKAKPTAPFFLAVGLVRPHTPFIAPENCYAAHPEETIVLPEIGSAKNVPKKALRQQNGNSWQMNTVQKKQTIAAYLASVQFMDQQVGRLLDALQRLDLRDNTIVVFISDHGYNLGEHDCWAKVSLWEGSVRVPMIISYPQNKSLHGKTYGSITELIDLYPTLTDLCGLAPNQPKILQGKSHASFIKRNEFVRQANVAYTISYQGRAASIRTMHWRYTLWGKNAKPKNEELYDHRNDPNELHNLAHLPVYRSKLLEMRKLLKNYRVKATIN